MRVKTKALPDPEEGGLHSGLQLFFLFFKLKETDPQAPLVPQALADKVVAVQDGGQRFGIGDEGGNGAEGTRPVAVGEPGVVST